MYWDSRRYLTGYCEGMSVKRRGAEVFLFDDQGETLDHQVFSSIDEARHGSDRIATAAYARARKQRQHSEEAA